MKNEWLKEIEKAVEGIRRLKQIGSTEPFEYRMMIGYLNLRQYLELEGLIFEANSIRPEFIE